MTTYGTISRQPKHEYRPIELNPPLGDESSSIYMSPRQEKAFRSGKSRTDSDSSTPREWSSRRSSFLSGIPVEYRQSFVFCIVLFCSIILVFTAHVPGATTSPPSSSSSPSPLSSTLLPYTCKDCNFQECLTDMCAIAEPYLCTGGIAVHGCTAGYNFWPTSTTCSSCCTTINCQQTIARGQGGHPSCANECTRAQCQYIVSEMEGMCGEEAPFICLEGSAERGCSENIFYYAATPPTICSHCCDTRSCTI